MTATPEELPKESDQTNNPPNKKNGKRTRIFTYAVVIFMIIGILSYAIWWFVFRNHEETDDAYVGGNMIVLTSRQTGSVISYYTEDTNLVEQGQLLVQLDPTDYAVAYEQSRAAFALAVRQVRNLMEKVQEQKADVALQEANYGRTLLDYKNRISLIDSAAVSREDFSHSRSALKAAEASVNLARHKLQGAIASLGNTKPEQHPLIQQARSKVIDTYLQLKRCQIFAPATGYVAKRAAQVGQSIKSSTPLMSIVPLDSVWVDANFKETQLTDMRIGQKAHVTADIYGSSIHYDGIVGGLFPGSGSVFSLLPPQNASGNWIKIVQRVPVRIYLDAEQVRQHPLLLGLSVYVVVDTLDKSGPMLAEQVIKQQQAVTDVFDIPLTSLHSELDELIQSNLNVPSLNQAEEADTVVMRENRTFLKGLKSTGVTCKE